jgi:hypothetical protein
MAVERRQVFLAAAAVIALALGVWTFWPAATPVASGTQQARPRAGRANAAAPAEQGPVGAVKLEALSGSRNGPGEAQRNPFRFQPKAPPPAPPRSAPPETIEAPTKPVVTGPIGPPPPQPIPLKFVGVLERANGVKWAVLTDGKSPTPLYGRDGDIIDGRYLIVKIGAESIEMTHTNGLGRQVIRLTGQ